MASAAHDDNSVATLIGVSNADGITPIRVYVDPTTHRLLVDNASAMGTVTSVSVVSANGFAGTVANATTTPAITLTTTVTGILKGNGTAISAATAGSDYAVGSLGLAGGQTIAGSTLTNENLTLRANAADTTTGAVAITTSTASSNKTTGALTVAGGVGVSGTINANALALTTALPVTSGGTGVASISALSIWVANSANTITEVTPGAGNSVRINGAGTAWEAFTPSAGVPTTITVANEATDTTCFPAFFTAATGDLGPKTNANLTFNSNTGVATFGQTIVGSINGNAGTATALQNARTIGGVSFDGTANITVASATGGFTVSGGNLTTSAINIVTDTSTGTKFGTATNQKIAFYNSAPIVQPTGDVATALSNLGLVATPTIAATTITSRTLWGQTYDGSANVSGSLTAVGNITGGASSMTITAGTGASRTLALQSTTSGSVATTFLTGNADQSTTFGGNISGTGAWTLTGGAGNMTIVSGTGASRTMIFQTTTSGSTATTALTLGADQSATFAGHLVVEGVTSTGATGTGKFVFDGTPTLVTPVLGVATATSINGLTITSSTGTLTITNGKTFSVAKSLTLDGTDSTTMTFPSTSATIARTDAAQTFTGIQTFSQIVTTPATISVSSNAGTVTRSNRINNFTNSSAATMTITMSTTGALDGDLVMVRIFDASAAAQTITWVNTEDSTVTAPTTSNGSTTLPVTVGFQWNNATSKWRTIAKA